MSTFKKCSNCEQCWSSLAELLSDPDVELLGYQVNFDALLLGVLLFNHNACGTTFGVPVEQFVSLYDGPIYTDRKTGTDDCPGYCLRETELEACPAKCECAFVREIMQTIRNWPGRAA